MSFTVLKPSEKEIPFLLSLPHCGTAFPDEIKSDFVESLAKAPDDTDWYLDQLYDFAPELGATTIVPEYSRWVIDLNREPSSKPLYDDGRLTTPLCPATDFNERSIYIDKRAEVDPTEVERRKALYFQPYHDNIDVILKSFVDEYGIAVFWDGHSIRRNVPSIQEEDFPDFILGDNDGRSAYSLFSNAALRTLGNGQFTVFHNTPFKGGYLTRSKGAPEKSIHALQLEMSKDLYMSDDETVYDSERAAPVKEHLRRTLESVIGLIQGAMR